MCLPRKESRKRFKRCSKNKLTFKRLLGPLEGLTGLELKKSANQKLGSTYVKDITLGCYLLCKAENIRYKAVNVATEEVVSFPGMARLAQNYSDIPTEVKIGPGKFVPRGEILDISVVKKELGFFPCYSTEDGMREYMLSG